MISAQDYLILEILRTIFLEIQDLASAMLPICESEHIAADTGGAQWVKGEYFPHSIIVERVVNIKLGE